MLNTLNITPYPKLAVPTPNIKGVPLDPSVLNTFKQKENKFEINPIVSQSVNGLVSGFNKMSEFSKNSYENANKTFYDNQSAYDGLNKNLYTTSQDLYGKTYFQKGGIKEEYENIRSLYDTFNSIGETDLASIYSDQLQNLEPEYQKLTLDQYAEQQRTIEDLNSKVRFLENQSSQEVPLIPYSQKYPDYEESNQEGYLPTYAPPLNIGFNRNNMYQISRQLEGMRYQMGAKGSNNKIDCSGAVCKIVGAPTMTSEDVTTHGKNFRRFQGVQDLQEGTVLGFDFGPKKHDKGRKIGIDHTGVIVKNPSTNQLEYKESVSGTGFRTLSIPQFLQKYPNRAKQIFVSDYGKNK